MVALARVQGQALLRLLALGPEVVQALDLQSDQVRSLLQDPMLGHLLALVQDLVQHRVLGRMQVQVRGLVQALVLDQVQVPMPEACKAAIDGAEHIIARRPIRNGHMQWGDKTLTRLILG